MHIHMVTPAPAHSRKGNRITALRWARMLRSLGHRVTLAQDYQGERCDVLIALHARRSHPALARYRAQHPTAPLIVALTGTDLYQDIHRDPDAQASLEMADLLVTLQPLAVREVPRACQGKVRTILQSVPPLPRRPPPNRRTFDVAVVGHLRPVKDPFLPAEAARLLSATSRIRIVHIGGAMEQDMEERATREMKENPRYLWCGEYPRWKTRRRMAACRALVLPSKMEGGANAISEAIVDGVPVIASHIPGSIGMLGEAYPAYFPVGEAKPLAALLTRIEEDPPFLATLAKHVRSLAPDYRPEREQRAWRDLLKELP